MLTLRGGGRVGALPVGDAKLTARRRRAASRRVRRCAQCTRRGRRVWHVALTLTLTVTLTVTLTLTLTLTLPTDH